MPLLGSRTTQGSGCGCLATGPACSHAELTCTRTSIRAVLHSYHPRGAVLIRPDNHLTHAFTFTCKTQATPDTVSLVPETEGEKRRSGCPVSISLEVFG